MTSMRSPVSHHLGEDPSSLHHFLHRPEHKDVASLAGIFRRPTYEAFLRHSQDVIDRHGLEDSMVCGRVGSVKPEGQHLLVQGEGVELRTRRLLIATGSNVPRVPAWARKLQKDGAPIRHLFGSNGGWERDLLGGGISAVQRALMVHRETKKPVRIWMRRPIQVADFDYDWTWGKHKFQARWSKKTEHEKLEFLDRYMSRGSVPEGLAARLRRSVRRGSIIVELGTPTVEWDAKSERLILRGERQPVESSGLALVTGLERESVSGWVKTTADQLGLPTAGGLPRLDEQMHWGRGVYVSGPLARLRLGPTSTNIVGGRWAAAKLPGVRMQPV